MKIAFLLPVLLAATGSSLSVPLHDSSGGGHAFPVFAAGRPATQSLPYGIAGIDRRKIVASKLQLHVAEGQDHGVFMPGHDPDQWWSTHHAGVRR